MDINTLYIEAAAKQNYANGHKFWSFPEASWDDVERQSFFFFFWVINVRVWNKIGGEEKRLLEKAEIGEKRTHVVRKNEEKMGI